MDYSIEALIAEGTGLKTRDDTSINVTSNERFDGYFDAVQAELTRSFENLEFLDTLSRVDSMNTSAKLRMLKRLKRVYGNTIDDVSKASSVESFIDSNIRSIEENEMNNTNNTATGTIDSGTKKDPSKFKKFINMIIEGLKKLAMVFRKMINGIITRFRTIIRRKDWRKVVVKSAEEIKNDLGDKIVNVPKLNVPKAKMFLTNLAGRIDVKGIIKGIKKNNDIAKKMDNKSQRNDNATYLNSANFDSEELLIKVFDAKYVSAADAAKFKVDALYQKLVNMEDVCKIGERITKRLEESIKTIEGLQNGGAENVDQAKVNEAATYLRNMTNAANKVVTYGSKAIIETITKLVKDKPAKGGKTDNGGGTQSTQQP